MWSKNASRRSSARHIALPQLSNQPGSALLPQVLGQERAVQIARAVGHQRGEEPGERLREQLVLREHVAEVVAGEHAVVARASSQHVHKGWSSRRRCSWPSCSLTKVLVDIRRLLTARARAIQARSRGVTHRELLRAPRTEGGLPRGAPRSGVARDVPRAADRTTRRSCLTVWTTRTEAVLTKLLRAGGTRWMERKRERVR